MKNRLYFVSNSNGNSYVIVGVYLLEMNDKILNSIEKK